MAKRKPTGFVAVCQCTVTTGALDLKRTDHADVSRLLGKWLADGCTFDGTWEAQIQRCQCADNPQFNGD